MTYTLHATDNSARAGELHTRRGSVQTPFFMSVATRAAIKAGVSTEDLELIGSPVTLCNTYHLALKPGSKTVRKLGGLHNMMGSNVPILTDSGGFQVFSLGGTKITQDGVHFKSHIDGKPLYIDAERSIQIQHDLGSDIMMVFDDCPPNTPDKRRIGKAVERTTAWAARSIAEHKKLGSSAQVFSIVQGGCFSDLREKSLKALIDLNTDGYALGGLAVGEESHEMYSVLDHMCPLMPEHKPRYLMGVGTPSNLLEAIARGIDMFDCVLPMRNGRHGIAYTWDGAVRVTQSQYEYDLRPLDPRVPSPANGYSRAYIRHLLQVGEALGQRLMTLHNLAFYHQLMRESRTQILAGTFTKWSQKLLQKWGA